MEEKVESKAAHRAGQPNKIKGEATFAEGAHGTLKFKVETGRLYGRNNLRNGAVSRRHLKL